jgi:ABC-type nitrate/sulfonate/bicarbonate transport system substrate-binding protein
METLRIGLEWFLNPDHVPFLVALERGWFEGVGLEIELIEPEEHLDAFEAIEAGEVDVAVTEPLHLVEDRAAGHDVVGFARFLHTNGGVMYLRDSGIERPRDMAGKRLQYPGAPGPGGPAIVETMIAADGGDPDAAELEPVNRGFQHTDALIEGDADLAALSFYNFEVVEARQRGHDADFFALKDWGVPDFCQLILVTSAGQLEERYAAFAQLVRVMGRGIDFLHQNPDEARRIYFEHTETDPDDPMMSAIFAATVPCFTFDFSMSRDYYLALQSWMHGNGLVDRALEEVETYWTNDLAI